jgi:hypothetical protein
MHEDHRTGGERGVLLGSFPLCTGPSQFAALEVLNSSLSVLATMAFLESKILDCSVEVAK